MVQQYEEKFEELNYIMRTMNPGSSEAYFLSSFISGLNDKLRSTVKMERPKLVKEVAKGAGL